MIYPRSPAYMFARQLHDEGGPDLDVDRGIAGLEMCGSRHPALGGVVCVRDPHLDRVHRYWRRVRVEGRERFLAVVWGGDGRATRGDGMYSDEVAPDYHKKRNSENGGEERRGRKPPNTSTT